MGSELFVRGHSERRDGRFPDWPNVPEGGTIGAFEGPVVATVTLRDGGAPAHLQRPLTWFLVADGARDEWRPARLVWVTRDEVSELSFGVS